VAKGLQYLHSFEIIHGNLKGANVLISESGKAQICDYGLSPIISSPIADLGVTASSRWLASEIIDPPSEANSKPLAGSKSADVFAFAMLAVEVFSGRTPFEDVNNALAGIRILEGKRPAKSQAGEQLGLTAEMWKLIEKCWNASPNKRPTIDEVVGTWEGFVNGYVLSFGSSASQHITPRNNNRSSTSKGPGRRSQFVESSTTHGGEHGKPS
ncbi:kinase-like protein, partial [Thelephora ganbajun]